MKPFAVASVLAAMALGPHEAATAQPVYEVGAARSVSVAKRLGDIDVRAREKARLRELRPGGNRDRDPRTIEGIAPDGSDVLILIQASDPELFKGMTPAEFAAKAYP